MLQLDLIQTPALAGVVLFAGYSVRQRVAWLDRYNVPAAAFAPLFEQAGLGGAPGIAIAAAMAGIVSGGVLGGPIGTWLVERRGLRPGPVAASAPESALAFPTEADALAEPALPARGGEDVEGHGPLLRVVVAMLVAMGLGTWISQGLAALGLTLPVYIGAMLAASALRNLDDVTGWLGLSQRLVDELGGAALSLFLVLALLGLRCGNWLPWPCRCSWCWSSRWR